MLKKVLLSLFVCLSVAVGAGYVEDRIADMTAHCAQPHMTVDMQRRYLNTHYIAYNKFRKDLLAGTFEARHPFFRPQTVEEYDALIGFSRNKLEDLLLLIPWIERPSVSEYFFELNRRF
jgi:hypothetical protein